MSVEKKPIQNHRDRYGNLTDKSAWLFQRFNLLSGSNAQYQNWTYSVADQSAARFAEPMVCHFSLKKKEIKQNKANTRTHAYAHYQHKGQKQLQFLFYLDQYWCEFCFCSRIVPNVRRCCFHPFYRFFKFNHLSLSSYYSIMTYVLFTFILIKPVKFGCRA